MKMTNAQWKLFFITCSEVLGRSARSKLESNTWCAWTIFGSIGITYWNSGLPNIEDLCDTHIKDNGIWSQPFKYEQIAHLIIPREFEWHNPNWTPEQDEKMLFGLKTLNIDSVSKRLTELEIDHNLSEHCLEIKLF